MKPGYSEPFTAYVGIDWADTKHDICLQAAGDDRREFDCIAHQVPRIDEWVKSLYQRFGGPIAIALELAKGPIVYTLQKYDFLVLFPIHPSTLAKYRLAFKPSRAKDDPTDAEVALDLLMRHPERFAPLHPQCTAMRTLLSLTEQRRELVNDKTRLTNRLTNTLKQYYLQALEWFEQRDTILFCDFLVRWPTLIQAKRAHTTSLKAFFHAHNGRRPLVIDARLAAIKAALPLTEDPGVIDPCRLYALVLVDQLRITLQAIDRFDHETAALAPTLPDYSLFQASPGAGPSLAPRLLVAFGEDRQRFQGADELQKYAGIAPVTERSDKKNWVHWRWQCPLLLRQTFVEWAGQTINKSFWAGAYYRQQREKGTSYQAAVRALAFKWIRILFRCWKTRKPYDEATYLNALKKRVHLSSKTLCSMQKLLDGLPQGLKRTKGEGPQTATSRYWRFGFQCLFQVLLQPVISLMLPRNSRESRDETQKSCPARDGQGGRPTRPFSFNFGPLDATVPHLKSGTPWLGDR